MALLEKNAEVFREIVPQVARHAGEAVLLVATNPVDALTVVAQAASGLPPERVIGSGTALDTARLRALLAARAGVSARHVHGYVLGEHGDSEMIAWSGASVAGVPLRAFFKGRGERWTVADEDAVLAEVRGAAYAIIERKEATYYGVGAALARITEVILNDERAVLSVAMTQDGAEGPVAYSLPRVLGRAGVLSTLPLDLSAKEERALERSVAAIRSALAKL